MERQLFVKVFIHSVDDLPQKEDWYEAHDKKTGWVKMHYSKGNDYFLKNIEYYWQPAEYKKIFKEADIHKLHAMLNSGEISYSRMVEIMNEMVQTYSPKQLSDVNINPDCDISCPNCETEMEFCSANYLCPKCNTMLRNVEVEFTLTDDRISNVLRDQIISKQDQINEHYKMYYDSIHSPQVITLNEDVWNEYLIILEQELAALRSDKSETTNKHE